MWFVVFGMYGGFDYVLCMDGDVVVFMFVSWSCVVGGLG